MGLRGSPNVDDGAVPADPTTGATSNAGDKPASGVDEGDTMQQNGGDKQAQRFAPLDRACKH